MNVFFKVALLYLTAAFTVAQLSKFTAYYDDYHKLYSGDAIGQSIAISLFGLVGIVISLVFGILNKKISAKNLAALALATGACSSLAILFLPYPLSLIARTGEAASHILFVISAPSLIMTVVPVNNRAAYMSLWGTFFAFGFVLNESIIASIFDPSTTTYWIAHPAIYTILLISFHMAFTTYDDPKNNTSTLSTPEESNKNIGMVALMLSMQFLVYAILFIGWQIAPNAGSGTIQEQFQSLDITTASFALMGNIVATVAAFYKKRFYSPLMWTFTAYSALLILVYYNPNEMASAKFFLLGILPVTIFSSVAYVCVSAKSATSAVSAIMLAGNTATFLAPSMMNWIGKISKLHGLILIDVAIFFSMLCAFILLLYSNKKYGNGSDKTKTITQ